MITLNYRHSINKKICRVCYCDDIEVESCLVSPCNCLGGIKYIHFSCLQTWLKSKIKSKNDHTQLCLSYEIKQIDCELCKSTLPGKYQFNGDIIKYQDKYFELWDFLKPTMKNYIIFESYKEEIRSVYIVNLDIKRRLQIVMNSLIT
jgi:hypothetical protein